MSGIFNTCDFFCPVEDTAFMRDYHNRTYLHDQPRHLKLDFLYDINNTVYTGKTFQELGIPVEVALIDEATGDIVRTGPESSLRVEIVVLHKDFNQDNWTTEQFNGFIVEADGDGKQRKRSLLRDQPCLFLRDGHGVLGDISFRHKSRHMKKSLFRLGARVSNAVCGVRIKEAKSRPFTVKDRRIMSEKVDLPLPNHEVWRLKNISKGGSYHKRLQGRNINTVKDFVAELDRNPDNLRNNIMRMKSAKAWHATVMHAKTCVLYPEEEDLYACQPTEILGQCSESAFIPMIDRLQRSEEAELMVSAGVIFAPFKQQYISSSLLFSPDSNF